MASSVSKLARDMTSIQPSSFSSACQSESNFRGAKGDRGAKKSGERRPTALMIFKLVIEN
jgi:hypothetical protein